MIISKTRNANGWSTQQGNLIPNRVKCNEKRNWVLVLRLQLHFYTVKSQYWLHKAGASPEHWQFKTNNVLKKVEWKHKITQLKHQLKSIKLVQSTC